MCKQTHRQHRSLTVSVCGKMLKLINWRKSEVKGKLLEEVCRRGPPNTISGEIAADPKCYIDQSAQPFLHSSYKNPMKSNFQMFRNLPGHLKITTFIQRHSFTK